jgi:hypothetical protein
MIEPMNDENEIKKATMFNIVEIGNKIYSLNREDALEFIENYISEKVGRHETVDIKYIMSESGKDSFRLILLFKLLSPLASTKH